MRANFVVLRERYHVGGARFGAADKVGEVVLEVYDGIVYEQQASDAVEFHKVVAPVGKVLQEPAPHAKIKPVIFGQVKLNSVVFQERHRLCRKRTLVREQYDGKIGLGKVL